MMNGVRGHRKGSAGRKVVAFERDAWARGNLAGKPERRGRVNTEGFVDDITETVGSMSNVLHRLRYMIKIYEQAYYGRSLTDAKYGMEEPSGIAASSSSCSFS